MAIALPRIVAAKILTPTACAYGIRRTISLPQHRLPRAGAAAGNSRRSPRAASDIWGFVDADDGREYAVVGHRNGTVIVDVTAPGAPVVVGNIPGNPSLWREVKVLQVPQPGGPHRAYAYVTTEAPGGGLQIIDLTNLPASVSLANTLAEFSTSHTLYISNIDYATNIALPGRQALSLHRRLERQGRRVSHLRSHQPHVASRW